PERPVDPPPRGIPLGRLESPSLDEAVEASSDVTQPAIEEGLVRLDHRRLEPRLGDHLGDAAAHEAAPQHPDPLDRHSGPPATPRTPSGLELTAAGPRPPIAGASVRRRGRPGAAPSAPASGGPSPARSSGAGRSGGRRGPGPPTRPGPRLSKW